MNLLETERMKKIRQELSSVCKQLFYMAKVPGGAPGYEKYDCDTPEYKLLAAHRDSLGDELVEEWNRIRSGQR